MEKREIDKKLIMKVLLEPKFREDFEKNPAEAFGVKEVTPLQRTEAKLIIEAVRNIENRISSLADSVLCSGGGSCGIA